MGKHAHGPPEAAPAEVDCADWCTTDNAMNLQCSGCAWNVPSEGDTSDMPTKVWDGSRESEPAFASERRGAANMATCHGPMRPTPSPGLQRCRILRAPYRLLRAPYRLLRPTKRFVKLREEIRSWWTTKWSSDYSLLKRAKLVK